MLRKILPCLALLASFPVNAGVILDQAFDSSNNNGVYLLDGRQLAQSFTVGIAGTLSSIALEVYKRGSPLNALNVDLRSFVGNFPDTNNANVLASFSVDHTLVSSTSGAFLEIDLSSFGINVEVGEKYALVASSLDSSTSNAFLWLYNTDTSGGNPYVDGESCQRSAGANNWGCYNFNGFQQDRGFKVFTSVSDVPEPSILALMFTGLLGMGFLGRHRR